MYMYMNNIAKDSKSEITYDKITTDIFLETVCTNPLFAQENGTFFRQWITIYPRRRSERSRTKNESLIRLKVQESINDSLSVEFVSLVGVHFILLHNLSFSHFNLRLNLYLPSSFLHTISTLFWIPSVPMESAPSYIEFLRVKVQSESGNRRLIASFRATTGIMGVYDGNENDIQIPFLVFLGFSKTGISLVALATWLIGRQKNGDEMLVSIHFIRAILLSLTLLLTLLFSCKGIYLRLLANVFEYLP